MLLDHVTRSHPNVKVCRPWESVSGHAQASPPSYQNPRDDCHRSTQASVPKEPPLNNKCMDSPPMGLCQFLFFGKMSDVYAQAISRSSHFAFCPWCPRPWLCAMMVKSSHVSHAPPGLDVVESSSASKERRRVAMAACEVSSYLNELIFEQRSAITQLHEQIDMLEDMIGSISTAALASGLKQLGN